jgi:hypothetical protein
MLLKIPVDSKNKIDLIKLERTCREIEEANAGSGPKTKIIAMVGMPAQQRTETLIILKRSAK